MDALLIKHVGFTSKRKNAISVSVSIGLAVSTRTGSLFSTWQYLQYLDWQSLLELAVSTRSGSLNLDWQSLLRCQTVSTVIGLVVSTWTRSLYFDLMLDSTVSSLTMDSVYLEYGSLYLDYGSLYLDFGSVSLDFGSV